MGIKFTKEDLSGGGNYLGAGKHTVKIDSVNKGKSASGNDKIEVLVKDANGRESTLHLAMTPKAMWKIANLARACGHTDAYLETGDFLPSKDLPGKKFCLTIEEAGTRMYNGEEKKQYNQYFDPIDGAEPLADDDDIPF